MAIVQGNAIAQYSRSIEITKTFTSNGSFTLTDLSDIPGFDPDNEIFAVAQVDLLLVGGGGGGGRGQFAAGGGGGEVVIQSIDLNLGAVLSITIGNGGRGARQPGNNSNNGQGGENTEVILTSGAASISQVARGGAGGSLNGNGGNSGNGNPGGAANGTGQNRKGGGGGGAGSPGTNGFGTGQGSTGGSGGNGVSVSFAGGVFGAGGGGNARNGGLGGNGGGGNANPSGPGGNASPNSGSGGGAGDASSPGGNGANGIVIVQIVYRILPVDLVSFTARPNPETRSVKLSWTTSREWENSHFEIQRSIDSIEDWKTIGTQPGQGYSEGPVSYHYDDTTLPASSGRAYYRIKQVDFSGEFEYSSIISASFDKSQGKNPWVFYPNPSYQSEKIYFELREKDEWQGEVIQVSLMDSKGRSQISSFNSPDELERFITSFFEEKSQGLYLLSLNWGAKSQQLKIWRR